MTKQVYEAVMADLQAKIRQQLANAKQYQDVQEYVDAAFTLYTMFDGQSELRYNTLLTEAEWSKVEQLFKEYKDFSEYEKTLEFLGLTIAEKVNVVGLGWNEIKLYLDVLDDLEQFYNCDGTFSTYATEDALTEAEWTQIKAMREAAQHG